MSLNDTTASLNSEGDEDQFRAARLRKLSTLKEKGINPYPYGFKKTAEARVLQEQFKNLENGKTSEEAFAVAGRIMSIRNTGMFIDLWDVGGKIQIFSHEKALDAQSLEVLPLLDIGDIIGAQGTIRRTNRGELTLDASKLEVLSKSLRPLPEKYHGLTDVEIRYRQRYLDLIMNPETRSTLRKRSFIIREMRDFLLSRGFLEVETPMLHTIAGGAAAKPFVTHHNTLGMDLYLRIAPELYLKRLIVGGLAEKVFEINRCFRNEGISPRHNPEFTSVELYQAFADYQDMMALTEDMIKHILEQAFDAYEISYGDMILNFSPPWPRKSMTELVEEHTGLDFLKFSTAKEAIQAARALGIAVKPTDSWGRVVEVVFGEKVENQLIQPIHVIDLPKDISPLAKVHRSNPRLSERFESYINGWEIANAFSELSDPLDQKARFEEQMLERLAGDAEAHQMDEDFITALEYGMPPTGGLGIGIDRLVMLLTNASSIRDVIAFPTMRSKLG